MISKILELLFTLALIFLLTSDVILGYNSAEIAEKHFYQIMGSLHLALLMLLRIEQKVGA